MKPTNACLSISDIPLLLTDDLPAEEVLAAENHLGECASCRKVIESMIADSHWWDDAHHSLVANPSRAETSDEMANTLESITTNEQILELLGPTDEPSMLGRIAGYEIVALLGQGGMGAVFKAFDRSLNRYVAIKMLLPHLAVSGAARKRFAREAQAAAAIVDDHVMAIHGVSQWKSVPYFVMPYSRGMSLQKRLNHDGPLELREILRIGLQAAQGLSAAHAQGLVHRDVKPANIFLDEGVERVRLMDFGLARAADDASLTRSGTLAGTPQYMSPEQARAETVDHRSDLFSLGSVLYAMCTGHAPFRAESSYSILRLITDKEPRPIREINPDIPQWLCSIVSKLMAKQADERFVSAQQVAKMLEECLAHVQQPTVAPLPVEVARLAQQRLDAGSMNNSDPTSHRIPPAVRYIATGLIAFVLLLAGVLIVLESNKGTLTIESEVDNIPIRIKQGEKIVERLAVTRTPKRIRISAGEYDIEVDGDFPNIQVETGKVTLGNRDSKLVTIRDSRNSIDSASPVLFDSPEQLIEHLTERIREGNSQTAELANIMTTDAIEEFAGVMQTAKSSLASDLEPSEIHAEVMRLAEEIEKDNGL